MKDRCRSLRIGLTYDLRHRYLELGYSEEETAEFDSQATIDAIASALRKLGHQPILIGNVFDLMRRLVHNERWDMVFNIAEGLDGLGRESQIPALLDTYRMPYTFSDPCVTAICLHKGFAKRILRDAGLPTPSFVEVHREADLSGLDLNYPLFAKPIAEGTGKGIDSESRIGDRRQLLSRCRRLLERYQQPVLVEEYLPGREFTVGILGTGEKAFSLGALEVVIKPTAEQGAYSYANKERCEDLVEYGLVFDAAAEAAGEAAVEAWKALGCRDGGRVDIRMDRSGRPNIMELNPLAGLHPTHSDLPILAELVGMPYTELIGWILKSALERSEAVVGTVAERPRILTRRRARAGVSAAG